MNKKMSKRQKDIKSKLMAAICMLLVSSIMMVSTTYAWFTLSTAPEVTGITTAVGSNGNLEIALMPAEADLTRLDDAAVIPSAVGNSSAATGTTVNEANVTWGNLVDVSDSSYYGMNKIQLYPAALNTQTTADGTGIKVGTPLKVPVYGADGRVSELDDKSTITGIYNGSSEKFEENIDRTNYGVRAIGTASNLSARELEYRSAKTAAASAASDARTVAARSLTSNGNVLAAMAINKGTNGADSYTLSQVQSLANAVTTLHEAVNQVENAMLYYIVAESIAPGTVTDADYETIADAIMDSDVATIVADPAAVHASIVLPDGIAAGSTAVTKLAAMKSSVGSAKTTMDGLVSANKASYTWAEFDDAINAIMSTNGLKLNNFTVAQLLDKDEDGNLKNVSAIMSAALGEGLKLQMGDGSGIYADIAEFCGNYTASITLQPFTVMSMTTPELPATMMTTVTSGPYLTAIQSGLTGFDSGSGTVATAKPITTYYGYIIDLAFRTNAANSNLMLQTSAIDRVYSDNTSNEATMGHGASMSFYSPDEENFKPAQVQRLMGAIRVVFFDTATGTIIQEARLDPETAVTEEKTLTDASVVNEVTMDLVLWDATTNAPKVDAEGNADAAITALDQNKAMALSALVYLDGEKITNADVAAENRLSMTGSMNLQFSSDATLVPMEYADLRTGNSSSSDDDVPEFTTITPSVTVDPSVTDLTATAVSEVAVTEGGFGFKVTGFNADSHVVTVTINGGTSVTATPTGEDFACITAETVESVAITITART